MSSFIQMAQHAVAQLAHVSPMWLAAGIALHLMSQVVRLNGWKSILQTAYPEHKISLARVVQVNFAGSWVGIIVPKGGQAVKLVLLKRMIPNSTFPGLGATLLPESLTETAVGIALITWAVSNGLLASFTPHFSWEVALISLFIIVGATVLARQSKRVKNFINNMLAGLMILKQPGRFVTGVVFPQLVGRVIRLLAIVCFMAAFDLPHTLIAALLVMTIWGASGFLPGGAAIPVRVAALVMGLKVLGFSASTTSVTGYVLGEGVLMMLLSICTGMVAIATMFDTRSPRKIFAEAKTLVRRNQHSGAAVA